MPVDIVLTYGQDDLRADLQESGVLLHDVTRKANSSDLAILVEILKLVIDSKPPHCIILISGDRDFANILSTLTFRKYQVYLIHSPQVSPARVGREVIANICILRLRKFYETQLRLLMIGHSY